MFSHNYFAFFSRIPLSRISRVLALKTAVFVFLILSLAACEPSQQVVTIEKTPTPETMQSEKVPSRELLTRGVYSDLVFNPHQAMNTAQATFLQDVLEGLTAYDKHGQVIPAVAERWETEDYKTWLFILRDNAKWSNGEAVTAQDFVLSWQQLVETDNPLRSYFTFLNVVNSRAVLAGEMPVGKLGVEAVEPTILRIQLDKATPQLPAMLAHVALLPRYQSVTEQFIGNGAYRVMQQQGDRIHLEKNVHYWANQQAAFKFVDYKKIAPSQPISEMDIVVESQQTQHDLHYFPKLCTYYYEFNFNDPLLQKKAVRQALTSMISSQRIVQEVVPQMWATPHFLPDSMQMISESAWEPVVVEQILKQHGITETSPLQLKLTYDQGTVHASIAQRLIQMWSQSDMIRVSAEPVSWQQLLAKRATGDFQLIRSGWCADYSDPMAFLYLFYSHSPDNKMGYRNVDVDKLAEATLSVQTPLEREKLYHEIANKLQQDYVVLPLFQETMPIFIHSSIAGYQNNNPTGVLYSKDLYRKVGY
ncbi:peptide ABC transporter substrate-binding protein [Pasteurella sp. P03HT]